MRIAELYQSVQGEGLLTGVPSVFVRASGCNLRCGFCDTPYTSWAPEGDDRSVGEILAQSLELGASHVVITGGEPMLFAELVPLCEGLRAAGRHITIETAGTLYLDLECDLMSISPKRANSTPPIDRAGNWTARHERTRHQPAVIRRLIDRYEYQFKFVIDRPEDVADVREYLTEFPTIRRDRTLLMPQATDLPTLQATARWLEPYCEEHDFRYCPRRHVEWYGFRRGT